MLAFILLIQSTAQGPLHLTCVGAGTANKVAVVSGQSNTNVFGSVGTTPYSGTGNTTATIYGQRQQEFSDQVDVRLFTADDRIRLPRTMLTLLHGGKGGWFKVKKLEADKRSIRFKAAMSALNNPNVYIDRITGTISISGKAGNYTGQCQVIDPQETPRF